MTASKACGTKTDLQENRAVRKRRVYFVSQDVPVNKRVDSDLRLGSLQTELASNMSARCAEGGPQSCAQGIAERNPSTAILLSCACLVYLATGYQQLTFGVSTSFWGAKGQFPQLIPKMFVKRV